MVVCRGLPALICNKGGVLLPGLIDIGVLALTDAVPDLSGVMGGGCGALAGACSTVRCAGGSVARMYQHFC